MGRLKDKVKLTAEVEEEKPAPTPKTGQQLKRSRAKARKTSATTPGCIVYVGHLPHGFLEPQLRQYFMQFGTVTGTYVARSKRTGRSRGFAFVRFLRPVVAKVAADAMHNYLMFEKLLVCHVVKKETETMKLAKWEWARAGPNPVAEEAQAARNAPKSPRATGIANGRLARKLVAKNAALAAAGVSFHFPVPSKGDLRASSGGGIADESAATQPSTYSILVDSEEEEISFSAPSQTTRKSLRDAAEPTPKRAKAESKITKSQVPKSRKSK